MRRLVWRGSVREARFSEVTVLQIGSDSWNVRVRKESGRHSERKLNIFIGQ